MTAPVEEPPPAVSRTPILDQKLRNLTHWQLAIIFTDKEPTECAIPEK